MPNKLTPRYCVCKYAKLHAEKIELKNKRHKSLASPLKPIKNHKYKRPKEARKAYICNKGKEKC